MSASSTPTVAEAPWSKHRIEALTDGIFAVAMTLLVIELKLPDPHTIVSTFELKVALAHLVPKAFSWVVSFFVLAIFWVAHHRVFHHVRHVDGRLLWINLVHLAAVSLLPFSSALAGELGFFSVPQAIYNGNMTLLGLLAMAKARYVHRHPQLGGPLLPRRTYEAIQLRLGVLVAVSLVGITIALSRTRFTVFVPMLYLLMIPAAAFSRRREAKARLVEAASAAAPTPPAAAAAAPPSPSKDLP